MALEAFLIVIPFTAMMTSMAAVVFAVMRLLRLLDRW